MDRNIIRAGLRELRDVVVRILDHQVAIQDAVSDRADSLDDQRTDRDIRDEVAVHDINVQPLGACFDPANGFLQTGEVRGEKRWGDDDWSAGQGWSYATALRQFR